MLGFVEIYKRIDMVKALVFFCLVLGRQMLFTSKSEEQHGTVETILNINLSNHVGIKISKKK